MICADLQRQEALRRVLTLLALASSIVVATEFIVIGLLPVIARHLGVSTRNAGQLTGMFALSAGILGPLVTLLVSTQAAKRLMIAALLLFAAGNAVAVLVPRYEVLLTVRILQGATLPAFISVGTGLVSQLADERRRGQTLAQANWGFVIGVLGALPAGVALAQGGHWQTPLIVLSVLAIFAALAVAIWFPSGTLTPPHFRRQATLILCRSFLTHLMLTVAAFAASFAAYTYLSALLTAEVGLDMYGVALALFGFGATGLLGNLIAASIADSSPVGGTLAAAATVALAAAGITWSAGAIAVLIPLLSIWGIAHTVVVTLCQVRVTNVGRQAPAFAMSMNISAANVGIAVGATIGGAVIDHGGLSALPIAPLALTIIVGVIGTLTRLPPSKHQESLTRKA